ncbi:N-acetylglucosaminyl transferase component-domain-containing protein [Amylostereum chailletii]|nr:N-acetylglucosaminyl transferase component-domain-containing protein [Amylostereum chailletii]
MNDLVLGFIIGSFVAEHHTVLGLAFTSFLNSIFVVFIRHSLEWLNDWPAGLKLNTELSSFCFHTFISSLRVCEEALQRLTPHLPAIVYLVGRAGVCGLTVSLALCIDLFRLLTFHVTLGHFILKMLLSYQLATLKSLWNLFRGKRYNTLHGHVDSWEYDVDQLLLGTILFTLFTFTLPTLLAYASLFALMKLVVATTSVLSGFFVSAMNNFPLFALLLKLKDPRRLPGASSSLVLPE